MPRNNHNRHLFRQVARESAGEIFDASSEDSVFFAYEHVQGSRQKTLIGVASLQMASATPSSGTLSQLFLNDSYHQLTYMFMKPRWKGLGYGSLFLSRLETAMLKHLVRSIRVESSSRAVKFFEKNGYQKIGEPIHCICPGSPLFARLIRMQKDF